MSKPTRLAGALAVVSGGSSGIGAALARVLAKRGCRVVLLARNAERLASVVDELRSGGGQAEFLVVDLAEPRAVAAVAGKILADYGLPDLLINNAGSGRWLSIEETTAEEAAQMMALPYLAAFNLTRELVPGMRRRGSGHIVNVTSVASRLAWPGMVAYAAARAAVEGFTNALRADLYGSGVAVTLASFGTVETPYWQNNPGSRERLPQPAAKIRVLPSEEVAEAIADAIERRRRSVVLPRIFRFLFWLDALWPSRTEAMMCK